MQPPCIQSSCDQGSDSESNIDGVNMDIGGDVIVAINGEAVQDMDDLIAVRSSDTVVEMSSDLPSIFHPLIKIVTTTAFFNGQ